MRIAGQPPARGAASAVAPRQPLSVYPPYSAERPPHRLPRQGPYSRRGGLETPWARSADPGSPHRFPPRGRSRVPRPDRPAGNRGQPARRPRFELPDETPAEPIDSLREEEVVGVQMTAASLRPVTTFQ